METATYTVRRTVPSRYQFEGGSLAGKDCFPHSSSCRRWRGQALQPRRWRLGGSVSAERRCSAGSSARRRARRRFGGDGGVWMVNAHAFGERNGGGACCHSANGVEGLCRFTGGAGDGVGGSVLPRVVQAAR